MSERNVLSGTTTLRLSPFADMLLEGVLWQDGEEEKSADGEEEKPADAQEEKPERRGGVA